MIIIFLPITVEKRGSGRRIRQYLGKLPQRSVVPGVGIFDITIDGRCFLQQGRSVGGTGDDLTVLIYQAAESLIVKGLHTENSLKMLVPIRGKKNPQNMIVCVIDRYAENIDRLRSTDAILKGVGDSRQSLHSFNKKFPRRQILNVSVCCNDFAFRRDKTDSFELIGNYERLQLTGDGGDIFCIARLADFVCQAVQQIKILPDFLR